MELVDYLRVFLKRWWLILFCIVCVTGATYVLTKKQTPVYQSVSTVVASPSTATKDLNTMLQGLDTLARQDGVLETYRVIMTSQTIVNSAAAQVGLSPQQLKLEYKVSADIPQTSNVVAVTVTGPDPDRTAGLANQIAALGIQYVQTLYSPYDLKQLDKAAVPAELISPKPLQNLALGSLLGLLLGMVLAFLAEYLRMPDTPIEQNIVDPRTGAYNEAYFSQRLNQELARARRQNYPLSVGVLQVENLGKLRGGRATEMRAQALHQVAISLKPYLRPEDVMARIGPDQFAFLFPDTPGYTAKETMQRLQGCIERTIFQLEPSHVKLSLGSSSGVISNSNGLDPNELMIRAVQALRQAGMNGLNRIQLWDEQGNYVS